MVISNVCILDYGSGNVKSVFNIFSSILKNVVISNKPEDITTATHIVLPGVGAFGSAMEKINKNIPLDLLETEVLKKKKPFLGICVGMQLLANISYENGEHKGLGWIDGQIKKLPTNNIKLPHMGWNEVEIINNNKLVEKGKLNEYYFVHSYFFDCEYKKNIIGETDYGINFTSFMVGRSAFSSSLFRLIRFDINY